MSDTQTTNLTRLVRRLVPAWSADPAMTFTFLSGGYSNENYRFDHDGHGYVLRVPSRVRPFVDRAHEFAFYDSGAARVNTPELIAFDVDTGVMVSRFEPGRLLADAPPDVDSLVGYLRSLHAALPASGRSYDPLLLSRQFLAEGSVPPGILRLSEVEWSPVSQAPCHNDLNPWNIIISAPDRWVTLDWEWFGDNDPLFDLVTVHQGLDMDQTSLAQMAELWAEGPVDNDRLSACLHAFWLREYAWAHAELTFGSQRDEIVAQLNTAADRLAALTS